MFWGDLRCAWLISCLLRCLLAKNCWTVIFMEDCRIISRRITEIKLNRSLAICQVSELISNYIWPWGESLLCNRIPKGNMKPELNQTQAIYPPWGPKTQGVCNHHYYTRNEAIPVDDFRLLTQDVSVMDFTFKLFIFRNINRCKSTIFRSPYYSL